MWLTVEEYAHAMRVHPATVRKACREGKLENARKVGRQWRIKEDDPMAVGSLKGESTKGLA